MVLRRLEWFRCIKKGSKVDPGNYRPVSILCVMSKILEHAVHSQMKEYLEKKGILFEYQSGFRGKYSTDSCLADITDYVKGEIAAGNLVGMVCIDLQKAFDMVAHDTLLEKLQAFHVSNSAVNWFESNLSCRRQCVDVNGTRSDFLEVQWTTAFSSPDLTTFRI